MEEGPSCWITRGFEAFSRGVCGNGGQNLYISAAGVLQRIHQTDMNRDGYADLLFCNSQNHGERPPALVYHDVFGSRSCSELPADGARTAAVGDLNGDGYDDLILGLFTNGIREELNAVIYYGGPDGLSERRAQLLPVPFCASVAIGDFNGDGRPDLAFASRGQLRIFYQTAHGFEPGRYSDLAVPAEHIDAADMDGDGYSDLAVRTIDGRITVYWGGPDGLQPDRVLRDPENRPVETGSADRLPGPDEITPLIRILTFNRQFHVADLREDGVVLRTVGPGRQWTGALNLPCKRPMDIVCGDFNGNGHTDMAVACRDGDIERQASWIFEGGPDGLSGARRIRLATRYASSLTAGDLDGDGRDEILICQAHTPEQYTTESIVFREAEPVLRLVSHDARRGFFARSSDRTGVEIILVGPFSRDVQGDIPVYIYPGGADGFSAERRVNVPGFGAVEGLLCDVNDDGLPDLILANASENAIHHDPGSYIYHGRPEGFSSRPDQTLPTTRSHGVCCADLDRDGYLDLIFCGFDNPELVIFYGGPNGFDPGRTRRIRMEYQAKTFKDPRWIYLADLNQDGWLDLVVPQIADDYSFILWGGPDGFSMDRLQFLCVRHAACARVADLNRDGYPDLIMGGHIPSLQGPHDSFVYIYWNGPDGLREDWRTLLPASAVNAMAVADFNNDGWLDLFICSYHDGRVRDIDSYLYWNRPGRGFSAIDRTRFFTHSASGCVAADFNSDGWVDLAIAYHKTDGDHVGHSAVWWNSPDGFDERRITLLPTCGPHGMTATGPGNIMDAGADEYYVSCAYRLPDGAAVEDISWEAAEPPGTRVGAQMRFAGSEDALSDASWQGPQGPGSWHENGDRVATKPGAWIQYRLALTAVNGAGTPRVHETRVGLRQI
jgi:hypothetical protein